jgi:thymidine kinase
LIKLSTMNHEVITGPMFAGKTTTLIERIQSCTENKIVIKPQKDDRYDGDSIVSHKKESYPAINAIKLMDLVPALEILQIGHVFIDEGHFFPDLYEFVQHHYIQSIHVVIAGLDTDYLAIGFEPMVIPIECSQKITKLRATCIKCKCFAEYTARYDTDDKQRIRVGGSNTYFPCCKKCHPAIVDSE